ncbi:MAG: TIGR00295 family protein [Archaeoglobaceae archaeon]
MFSTMSTSNHKKVWDKYGLPEKVRRHCRKVSEVAEEIAWKTGANIEIVREGALLHDIGRAVTHDPFYHFIASGEILREEGYDERIVRIAERHFSSGMTAEEAKTFDLPPGDYMPHTLEEKTVSLADNIVFGDKRAKFDQFLKRLDELEEQDKEKAWFTWRTRERANEIRRELEELSGLKF